MFTQIYQWKCRLENVSPFHIGDDDEHFVLNQFGYPFIPGTSLAGACRSFARMICSEEEVNTLFGHQNKRNRDAILIFSDGKNNENYQSELRTGIRINGATKTIEERALFTRHMVSKGATFDVTITLKTKKMQSKQEKRYVEIVEKILQAIQLGIIRLGSYKSIGGGKFNIQSCEFVHYDCTNVNDLNAYVHETKPYQKISIRDNLSQEGLIQITLKGRTASPLLIGGQYPNESDQPDETFMRTPDGKPFIPASSFKGVLRHRVERIANVLGLKDKEKYIAYLFGASPKSSKKHIGSLRFEDIPLKSGDLEKNTKTYYRIAINPFTGGTKSGALLKEETVVGSFETTLHLKRKNQSTDVSLALLIYALRDLALQKVNFGSGSSIGRGVLNIEHITFREGTKELTLHFDKKEIVGNEEWLTDLQRSLEDAKS